MKNLDRLKLNQADFEKFANEQRKLWRTPGSPDGIELDANDFEWLDVWEKVDYEINPPNDISRKMLRIGHYKGWMDCIAKL